MFVPVIRKYKRLLVITCCSVVLLLWGRAVTRARLNKRQEIVTATCGPQCKGWDSQPDAHRKKFKTPKELCTLPCVSKTSSVMVTFLFKRWKEEPQDEPWFHSF